MNAIENNDLFQSQHNDRAYWVQLAQKIASPVITNLANATLKKNMPVELSPSWDGRDIAVTYMEAFGRLLAGLAPWFLVNDDVSEESKVRGYLHEQSLIALSNSVDPKCPDYLLWDKESQPLVDAAYIAHAFLRAPSALWHPLSKQTKQRYIKEFKNLRRINPWYSNWLLFAAIIEAFLLSIDEQYDPMRIDLAIRKMNEWYAGDGWYKDGEEFHFDYYNSFVIQPMLLDIIAVLCLKNDHSKSAYTTHLKRMQRYCEHLERLISPEATFPAFGRSITYRLGAFQPLAQLALYEVLPNSLSPAQVRCALTAVMKRVFDMPGVFTKDNWLQLGLAGHQPGIANFYSNNGSTYITAVILLPLGLAADNTFWTSPYEDWSSRKVWSGQYMHCDYPVNY